ncbi:MAG: 4-hydroxythreonine-4-phosphate dehydrogenase PdxA [Dissulfurispiraceae bacterium]|jgi:4-hydroxythreonine-4-phosphate dehydrogenase|nr:4-hydroxythreonine-4-phosphate dehydrogenase PdxA [Dissulfurispiraceae bacterium]
MIRKKKMGFTMGDAAGIGPEVAVKAALAASVRQNIDPLLIGNRAIFEKVFAILSLEDMQDKIDILSPENMPQDIPLNKKPSVQAGAASVECIKTAVELALEKKIDAIVTAPISKESLHLAGYKWPGHTEMLAELTGTTNYAMMLTGGPLRVILATIHTSLKSAVAAITSDLVFEKILMAQRACAMLSISNPKIAVAALNPHAGEAGMFGDEEERHIKPAVVKALDAGVNVEGPLPADTVFHKAYNGQFDIIVCMYHDQGLIPLKMIAFDKGVNITVGLPVIRTSPDHGTAFDIAWSAKADPSSMIEAALAAASLKIC